MKLLSCLPKCALLSAVDDRESLHQLVCYSDIIKCTTKWQLNVCKETNFLVNDLSKKRKVCLSMISPPNYSVPISMGYDISAFTYCKNPETNLLKRIFVCTQKFFEVVQFVGIICTYRIYILGNACILVKKKTTTHDQQIMKWPLKIQPMCYS